MIIKKLLVMFWNLFFPPIIYKQKPEVKDHCGKHEAFKKGCPICRGMNA